MQVFDTFIFNDEVELLEIRLNILDQAVDKFVIVESSTDFFGNPKPFYFDLNQINYKNKDKIINVRLPYYNCGQQFLNDAFQKNMTYKHIENLLKDDDIYMYSDLDEIPNPLVIDQYKKANSNLPWRMTQQLNHYFLNIRVIELPWYGTFICSKQFIENKYKNLSIEHLFDIFKGASGCRQLAVEQDRDGLAKNIKNGGWHYTYFTNKIDGINNIVNKIKKSPHTEIHSRADTKYIKECIKNLSPINPETQPWKLEVFQLNSSNTSEYILNNLDKYKHLIYNPSIEL